MQENYFTYIYTVPEQINEMDIKNYLMDYQGYSSRLIRQIKREGQISLVGKHKKLYETIKGNDQLIVQFAKEKLDAEPEFMPLNIVHEDNDILVINKNWGIVTHATLSHPDGNLANGIAFHWNNMNIDAKIRFVNRLDRDTSGIVVVAKNKYSHHFIQNEMKFDRVKKIYNAIVEGIPQDDRGTIDFPIGRKTEDSIIRERMVDGQHAITHYKTIEKYKNNTLLEINIETGRTHQIRVHMKGIGHPILGDSLYNETKSSLIGRQALHGRQISFIHPRTKKMEIYTADLPEDILKVITVMRS